MTENVTGDLTENLTENDKFQNTYSNHFGLRILSVLVCLFSLIYFPKDGNKLFISYYDYIMWRDIFWKKDGFWKQMLVFMVMSYGVAMAVLIINAVLVKKERREGAFADIAIYGYLTLLNPIYVIVSMIGSKSSEFSRDKVILILILPFIFFLVMFIYHIRLYRKNIQGFYDVKDNRLKGVFFSIIAVVLVLALILLPVKNVISALKMSKDYSSNYGLYVANPGEIEGIDEDTIGNKKNDSFIWDDKLHIVCNDIIYVVDEKGELVERYNTGVSIDSFALYSNGTESVLYIGEVENDDKLMKYGFNIYSLNLSTEEIIPVYSEKCTKNTEWIYMFEVKDDYLYYMLNTKPKKDETESHLTIYRFRIPESAGEQFADKEMFVSDIGLSSSVASLFLYNYDLRVLQKHTFQLYKGAIYYNEREKDLSGYKLYRKDFSGKKVKDGGQELTENVSNVNIYKDKIYFSVDDEINKHSAICCMNLDGSDLQVLVDNEEEYVIIDTLCVSDDYIVYKYIDYTSEWKVIKRN